MRTLDFTSFFALIAVVFLIGCTSGSGDSQSKGLLGGSGSKTETTESGLKYIFHNDVEGDRNAELDDFLTMHMSYKTSNDSTIFSSFNRKNPLTFRFSKTLFRGALNEGLQMMSPGDSATFFIPVDKIYGKNLPTFVKPGEEITYNVKLIGVQTKDEYQKSIKNRSQSSKPVKKETTNDQ